MHASAALAVGAGVAARDACPNGGACTRWRTTEAVAAGSAIALFLSAGYGWALMWQCDPPPLLGDAASRRAIDDALARSARSSRGGERRAP